VASFSVPCRSRSSSPPIIKTPESWSLESRAFAISDGWRKHTIAYGLTAATAGELPADYEEKALAIAERQIALAGYRLTDEVREALK
jgi:hypothetical protein